eukprot:TRINITY_DN5241_c0_g1_i3.p1 TRINITY_DN5241_c0_g1~~TRINITY_DN5241_c0_g1_i3.p1  ORF type:complete len:623 (-),score=159.72 TRINITY_DN5241_c0_g1_i3:139-1887(-)
MKGQASVFPSSILCRSFCSTDNPRTEANEQTPDDSEKVTFSGRPIIALIGRPNVGKSTLFNRLVDLKIRKALIDKSAGTTRDRSYGNGLWLGKNYTVIDTGGIVLDDLNDLSEDIKKQALLALREAHLILFLTDFKEGLKKEDHTIARFLRKTFRSIPVIPILNKADDIVARSEESFPEWRRLGLGMPLPISAANGDGIGDMLDECIKRFPHFPTETEEVDPITGQPSSIRIAIVGQPNVGKSSIMNKILKTPRAVVSEVAGTTSDPVDVEFDHKGRSVTLIDTAGIKRNAKHEVGLRRTSVLWSLKVIERSHIAVLVTEPVAGITSQEQSIARHILEHNKSALIVVNKWDLLSEIGDARDDYIKHVREQLKMMDYVPIIFTSAKSGYRVQEILDTLVRIFDERSKKIPTRIINEIVKEVLAQHPPPTKGGKKLILKFGRQKLAAFPPTFEFFVNDVDLVHWSYKRFLENEIRRRYPFTGSPIRFVFRQNEAKSKYSKKILDHKKDPKAPRPSKEAKEFKKQITFHPEGYLQKLKPKPKPKEDKGKDFQLEIQTEIQLGFNLKRKNQERKRKRCRKTKTKDS